MTVRAITARMGAPAWMASTPTTASAHPSGQVMLPPAAKVAQGWAGRMDPAPGGCRVPGGESCPALQQCSQSVQELGSASLMQVPCPLAGQYCTEDVDECQLMPNACQNGGTCHNNHGGYNCVCVNGWTGEDCSENIDDCAMAACFHGATCHDRVASFYCECPHGRTGEAPSHLAPCSQCRVAAPRVSPGS